MKKVIAVSLAATAALLMSSGSAVAAANVKVEWKNPKEFTDVRPSNESRKRYRERVFRQFDEYFVELAERLPDGQTLEVVVTDVDLAGRVWPASFVGLGMSGSDVRLVKRADIPRMTFSYKLLDSENNVLKSSDEVKLKDMGFQDRTIPYFKNEPLRYEKNMIRLWFRDEFPQEVAKNS